MREPAKPDRPSRKRNSADRAAPGERLQKILARAGVASRRHAEQLIQAGRVRVNGKVITELGTRADGRRDIVEVDGRRVVAQPPAFIVLHKPRGVVSTLRDPEGRSTIADLVRDVPVRLFPVGRLDTQTSGAILLTNDGAFAAAMLHPTKRVPKIYRVKVEGEMLPADVERWSSGVELEDGMTLPADARVVRREPGQTWLELVLSEGRNRQIRRMGEATHFAVLRLTRVWFAGIGIQGLRAGQWRFLSADELRELRASYGVPKQIRAAVSFHHELATRSGSRRASSGAEPRKPARSARRGADPEKSASKNKPRAPKRKQ